MLQRLGPLMPVAAVLFGQRAPGGEVVERACPPGRGTRRRPAHGPAVRGTAIEQLRAPPAWPPMRRRGRWSRARRRVSGRRRAAAAPGSRLVSSANSGIASTRRYSGLTKRREVGRYGDGSIGVGRLGRVQRIDQHIVGAVRATPTTPPGRSGRSDRRRPTTGGTARYRAVRPGPTRGGRRAARAPPANPASRSARCWSRRRRSAGAPGDSPAADRRASTKLASPIRRPSRSNGGVKLSTCRIPVRTVPSSSCSHTSAGWPWVTCTQNVVWVPALPDDGRRQRDAPNAPRSCAARASLRSASSAASTPSAASTAINVLSGTSTRRPLQSS